MDVLKQLNDLIAYIETNLCDEINVEEISRIACASRDSFMRFFSYMTGMTLNEYIRRRRLTLAAYDLRDTKMRVIDVAVKYGYDSADAFAKAFVKQHGITPTQARDFSQLLKVYPPASFYIMIKGAKEMDFRIIQSETIGLRGLSKPFTGIAADRFEQEHIMWGVEYDDYMKKIDSDIPGTWYGIWNSGTYSIAKRTEKVNEDCLENITIPAGIYAVFSTGFGGFAGDELPRLRELIFDSWLADSGYIQTHDYEVEVYYLFPKSEKHKRHYEIWVPIERKKSEFVEVVCNE